MHKNNNISWKSVEMRLWERFVASLWLLAAPAAFSALVYIDAVSPAGSVDVWGAGAFGFLVGLDAMIVIGVLGTVATRWWQWITFARYADERNLPEIKHLLRQERLMFPHRS